METIIREVDVKGVLTKSNLPVSDFSVNPYVGCTHACKYCYASFMKRFSNHPEPWGEFVDVKHWPEIKNPQGYTCFISPIFPGITDVPAIIRRARAQCNLVWLENLNLRGAYKTVILDYIAEKRSDLLPLYQAIYRKGDRSYWAALDEEVRRFTALCPG